ncbi:MAG: YfhO family protein [Nitrospirota bacterium]|nr:YfhO family protein [Nitrospirota bacterium]
MQKGKSRYNRPVRHLFLVVPAAVGLLLLLYRRAIWDPNWIPLHDTLTQFTEFLYAYASFRQGELPLWNSYLYGGQPFYLLLNHGLLLNPIAWIWFALGTIAHMPPKQIFVACHLTEVVFFSFGGLLFVRELTRSTVAGTAMFTILLFCGEAGYWTTQIYRLGIIEYVPWVLYAVVRYVRRQTAGRISAAALIIAISMNVYYPAYLAAFIVTLLILLMVYYPELLRVVNHRLLVRHCLLGALLAGALILPTYSIYHDIVSNYYQIARYTGPEQTEQFVALPFLDLATAVERFKQLVQDLFITPTADYGDGAPMVGVLALGFALYELVACSRSGGFWFAAAVIMAFNAVGPATPMYWIMRYISPFYTVIRSWVFFESFLVFCFSVLASLGVRRFLVAARRPLIMLSRPLSPAGPIVLVVLQLGLLFFLPADQRLGPLIAIFLMAALIVWPMLTTRWSDMRAHIVPLVLLALLLVNGALSLHRLTGMRAYHNWQSNMFSYSDGFGFSFERPTEYLRVQPLGPQFGGECCVDYYYLAKRIDAPYFFDHWQSMHTQFVSKEYYRFSDLDGFDQLMRRKFRWFSAFSIQKTITEYGSLLEQGTIVLESDALVRNRSLVLQPLESRSGPAPDTRDGPEPQVLHKSANRLVLETQTEGPRFLLYTDTYHEGFIAKIDGQQVPVLKAMGVLKAVEVPEGRHVVEFIFKPAYRFVLIGYLAVAIPTVLGIIGMGIAGLLLNRKSR